MRQDPEAIPCSVPAHWSTIALFPGWGGSPSSEDIAMHHRHNTTDNTTVQAHESVTRLGRVKQLLERRLSGQLASEQRGLDCQLAVVVRAAEAAGSTPPGASDEEVSQAAEMPLAQP